VVSARSLVFSEPMLLERPARSYPKPCKTRLAKCRGRDGYIERKPDD